MVDQDNSHLMNSNPPGYSSDEPQVKIMLLFKFVVVYYWYIFIVSLS